jgi:mono/diheme cytochrome c family protein
LEGLGALTAEMARAGMKDADLRLRVQAIRASETLLKAGDVSLAADIRSAGDDAEPQVKLQSVLTAKLHKFPQWKEDAVQRLITSGSGGLKELGNALLETGPSLAKSFTPAERKQLERGRAIYQEVCFACHGPDGLGTPIPGLKGQTLAPPMAGSRTVRQGDAMLRVLLHGLEGPIDGKTYESQMIPQGNNSDAWLADITSYVRNAFGNAGEFVTPRQVADLRKKSAGRVKPWTIDELRAMSPQPMADRSGWKLSASHNPGTLARCVDGDPASRWDSAKEQGPGMWFQVELPSAREIAGIELECAASPNDSPTQYEIEGSLDGKSWKKLSQGKGTPSCSVVSFSPPASVRFLKIHQKGRKPGKYWSIHELTLLAPAGVEANR